MGSLARMTRNRAARPSLDPGRRLLVVIAVAATAMLAGSATSASVAHADPSPSYEVFTGSVDAFYQVPDPLPAGAPGQLIRVQAVSATRNQDHRAHDVPLGRRGRSGPGRDGNDDLSERRSPTRWLAGHLHRQRYGRSGSQVRSQPSRQLRVRLRRERRRGGQ